MKKRWIVIPSIALGLLGIAAIGVGSRYEFIGGRLDANTAASDLQSALSDLDGVQSASVEYAPFGLPDGTTSVAVAFASGASSESWGDAAALVDDASDSAALRPTTMTAEFSGWESAMTATVLPLSLPPEVVAAEIDSWRSLNEAVGDRVSLRLGAIDTGSATAVREYSVDDPEDMREVAESWTSALAESPSTLPTSWIGPGIQTYGDMPSVQYMTAVSEIASVIPLARVDGTGTGTHAAVLLDLRGIKVVFFSSDGVDVGPSPQLAEGVRTAFASGATVVEWLTPERDSYLVAGDCGTYESFDGTPVLTTQVVGDSDTGFAEQLASAGFVLPDGVTAGACQPVTA